MNSPIRFTGLESDQFVNYARNLLAEGAEARVEVHGREPITSSTVRITGVPVEARDVGYSRTLLVRTDAGSHFRIGGTNTTKSIACEELLFQGLPKGGSIATSEDVVEWASKLCNGDEKEVLAAVRSLTLGLRARTLDEEARRTVLNAALATAESSPGSVQASCLGLLGLLGGPKTLTVLTSSLRSEDVLVRRQAALRLRSMETFIIDNRSDPAVIRCVEELVERLRDDADESVRIYAAEDLGYFYDDAAVAALCASLRDDSSAEVRWACTVAIGRSNDPEAISVLQQALRREANPSIRRAALLGIGRHAADLLLRRPDLAREFAMELAGWIVERPGEGVDYAIHALGEFGEAAAPFLDLLVNSLENESIEVIAPATISIAKLLPFSDLDRWRGPVLRGLQVRAEPAEPKDWPEIGFYRAFLSSAGELSLALEDFALAADLFDTANAFEDQPEWLRVFHRGAAKYARAEHYVSTGDSTARAIELLHEALECFEAVSDSEAFAETDPGRSGLRLKQILAEARLAVLSALEAWKPQLVDKHDIHTMDQQLERANGLYRRLDLTNLSENEAKLSSQEVALIYSLQLIVGILSEACRLAEALIDHDAEGVSFSLGAVRAQCKRLVERSGATQSASLDEVANQLQQILARTEASASPVEAAAEILDLLPRALTSPVPAPGTCPIVTFGEAQLVVQPADMASGDGSQLDPFLVPEDAPLIFEGHVHVTRRTKDDELIFTADSHSTPRGEGIQYIPVHEGHYPLRPIEFTPLRHSSAARPFAFSLSFRNRGCLQPVDSIELWVRAGAPGVAGAEPVVSLAALEGIVAEIADLSARLEELDTALRKSPGAPTLARRRRELRAEKQGKEGLAAEMRDRLGLAATTQDDAHV